MLLSKKRCISCCLSLFVALGAAGAAWACSPQARFTIDPKSAPAGFEVQLEGSAFQPNTPVAFLWGGQNGPKLGVFNSDAEGEISARVSVPDVAPDVYFVLSSAGSGFEVARTSFTVIPQAGSAVIGKGRQIQKMSHSDLWAGTKAAGAGLQPANIQTTGAEAAEVRRANLPRAGLSLVVIAALALASTAAETVRRERRRRIS